MNNYDPYDLNRFVLAQGKGHYHNALSEIRHGKKDSHWIWYIFPQFEGLGHSKKSKFYSIKSLYEAEAYLNHPILGARLVEIVEAILAIRGRSAYEIFGFVDEKKVLSCATLFAHVAPLPTKSVFERLICKYYANTPDPKTLHCIGFQQKLFDAVAKGEFAKVMELVEDPIFD